MRYYVIRVERNKETGGENRQTYAFDTLDSAKVQFHEIMAADINSTTLNYALCVILNEHGGTEMKELWELAEEPESEE